MSKTRFVTFVLVCLLVVAQAALAEQYVIQDLDTMYGGTTQAWGINDWGDVVGLVNHTATGSHAFLWTETYGMQDLGTPTHHAWARDTNIFRDVVGEAGHVPGWRERAALWTGGPVGPITITDLGTLGPDPVVYHSHAEAINDLGDVVGYSQAAPWDCHAFLKKAGSSVMDDLGTLQGHIESRAYDINNSGQVVGFSRTSLGKYHAVLWEPDHLGVMQPPQDLGTLGGYNAFALGINNLGEVVGESRTAYDQPRAVLWKDDGNGNMQIQNLGTLGGNSHAYDINDYGVVCGGSVTGGTHHAFVWTETGGMQDLGALDNGASGWSASVAINNLGQIVGYSYLATGETRACLWSPNQPPTADAGPDQVVVWGANVSLDGSGSSDPEGDPLSYAWDLGAHGNATGPTPVVPLPVGTHTVLLEVMDIGGLTDTDEVTITVVLPSATSQLHDLTEAIILNVDVGVIAPELMSALLAKVDAAIAALLRDDKNSAKVAMNDLGALINQVLAQVDKKITGEAALEIIARAEAIIAALDGFTGDILDDL